MLFQTFALKPALKACVLAAALAACSAETEVLPSGAASGEASGGTGAATDGAVEAGATASATPSEATVPLDMLTLEGLGDLKIGQALPKGWKLDKTQASDECLTASSPRYKDVYAIVEGGKVRRVSAYGDAAVKLAEGIGVGASEADVKKWFAGFRSAPHAYVAAPAKYLTAPGAQGGNAALRFEIGDDSKVETIHIGTMPVLGYVEGCA